MAKAQCYTQQWSEKQYRKDQCLLSAFYAIWIHLVFTLGLGFVYIQIAPGFGKTSMGTSLPTTLNTI